MYRALNPGEETAVLGQETYADLPFRAEAHQHGAHRDLAHAHDSFQSKERHAEPNLPSLPDHDGFPILAQIRLRARDIQRIEKLPHDLSSRADWSGDSRWLATRRRRYRDAL